MGDTTILGAKARQTEELSGPQGRSNLRTFFKGTNAFPTPPVV